MEARVHDLRNRFLVALVFTIPIVLWSAAPRRDASRRSALAASRYRGRRRPQLHRCERVVDRYPAA
jgi:hypothetical protein